MKYYYVVLTEDGTLLGVTPDRRTAKRLAREKCRSDYGANLEFGEMESDSENPYWMGESDSHAYVPVYIIEKVGYYPLGTEFLTDSETVEIPKFLRRQAE